MRNSKRHHTPAYHRAARIPIDTFWQDVVNRPQRLGTRAPSAVHAAAPWEAFVPRPVSPPVRSAPLIINNPSDLNPHLCANFEILMVQPPSPPLYFPESGAERRACLG